MPKEGIEQMARRAREVNVRDVPLGVKPIKHIVEEIPLPGVAMVEDKSKNVEFTSVDGNTYTFAFRDRQGKLKPQRIALSVYLALVETEKGGLASTVLDAFGASIEDLRGQQVFPILNTSAAEDDETLEEASDFSLGSDIDERVDA